MTQHEQTEAIRRTVAEYERLQNDPVGFVALHTPDVAVVNIVGRRVLGRDALAEAMTEALASPLAKVRTTLDVEDIRFVRPDMALVSLAKHVHDGRDGVAPREQPLVGSLTLMLLLEGGSWRVALAQTKPRGTF